MYCNYHVENILDKGNSVVVDGYLTEGEVVDGAYVVSNIFKSVVLFFEKNPVFRNEINAKMLEQLEKNKGDRIVFNL